MNILLLILFVCFSFLIGLVIIKRWFSGLPILFSLVGAFLLGNTVSVPATYFFSVLFNKTTEPILWGVIGSIVISGIILYRSLGIGRLKKISLPDFVLILFSLFFSTWTMAKTFHGGPGGLLFVGSNNVFDFGLTVGLMRSMSWGANIPVMSPFFAGAPLFYHFFFNFWIALWEYFGVPTVWAVNIPSILSFSAMLIVIYYIPQIIAKQKPIVGWGAVLLTITNSSLAFWELLIRRGLSLDAIRALWNLPTYPFAGPFDGSTISIFMTLNNYVNQRHLGFAIALGLFIYTLASHSIDAKKITNSTWFMLGMLTGLLFLWNIAISLLVIACVTCLLLLHKAWKQVFIFATVSMVTATIIISPLIPFLYSTYLFLHKKMITDAVVNPQKLPTWDLFTYLWENLGILPVIAGVGYFVLPKKLRASFIPFILLFILLCVSAGLGKRGFDQKFLSFLIVGINTLAACGLVWLWKKGKFVFKVTAIIAFFILTVSGGIDFMPIKNEFAYPLIDKETATIITWIRSSTPKDAVFVSYADMIDPVVLAGRTNYFGFYGNVGWFDRSATVRRVYRGDSDAAKANHISYILIPKWQKNDFPYTVDERMLRSTYPVAYEDDRVLILRTGLSL